MANITVKNLATINVNYLDRNLSEAELTLQGGCVGKARVISFSIKNRMINIVYECVERDIDKPLF
jgi:hypothetical protein